jgi:ADP-heptose:LPS heptosyltransferase
MILISPYSRKLRDGGENPKNYPYWIDLISYLKKYDEVVQIGVSGEEVLTENFMFDLSLKNIEALIKKCSFWISVDNFFPHLNNVKNKKPGVVLFSQSDPLVFGYDYNLNILKDRKYLRDNQFDIWERTQYNIECYLKPKEIVDILIKNNYLKA